MLSPAGLSASARVVRPSLTVDVAFTLTAGTVTALIGPNGAGKSTLIAALSGLVPLDEGRIVLGDTVLDDTSPDGSGTPMSLPPGGRGVATSFQDGLLFDGISVLDNVAFGLRASGAKQAAARAEALALLEELGLAERADDRPRSLSGGLAARVGLARALAVSPRLLLLDEPFAALDAAARVELRTWLADLLAARRPTTLIVTHDARDALALAEHVLVLEGGRLTDSCAVADLPSSRSAYAAAFAR